jgi:hypothetical protein
MSHSSKKRRTSLSQQIIESPELVQHTDQTPCLPGAMSSSAAASVAAAPASAKRTRVSIYQRNTAGLFCCPTRGCGFVARKSNGVTKHILTHTGMRPIHCS